MRSSEDSGLTANTQGAIFIEFLFVVLPFMIIVLGLTQTALMYLGGLAVKRSAATAARAAMVVFDDDPEKYGGQGRNTMGGQREDAIKMAAAFPIFCDSHIAKERRERGTCSARLERQSIQHPADNSRWPTGRISWRRL